MVAVFSGVSENVFSRLSENVIIENVETQTPGVTRVVLVLVFVGQKVQVPTSVSVTVSGTVHEQSLAGVLTFEVVSTIANKNPRILRRVCGLFDSNQDKCE